MNARSEHVYDRQAFAEGETIFTEGDVANRAYIVQEGRIEIFRRTDDGEEIRIGSVGKGGIFGEMGLIDDKPRMATARAAVDATVIVVPKMTFETKLAKCDPFIRGLLGILVNTVRSTAQARADLSAAPAGVLAQTAAPPTPDAARLV